MKNKVAEFILDCINEMEADGYQTWEDDTGEVPLGSTPDSWTHDDNATIWVEWGGDEYEVVVRKKRKKPTQQQEISDARNRQR